MKPLRAGRDAMFSALRKKELEKSTHRKSTMLQLICIALAVAFGLGFVAYHIYNTPTGYQDAEGFHFGEETK